MVRIFAAELMVLGTMCYFLNPKSLCAKGIWLSSIPTAYFIVQAVVDGSTLSRRILMICVACFAGCVLWGIISTFRKRNQISKR